MNLYGLVDQLDTAGIAVSSYCGDEGTECSPGLDGSCPIGHQFAGARQLLSGN